MSSNSAAAVHMRREPSLAAMRVEAWLTRAVRRRPERAAVNALTYSQLDAAASAGARDLHARGVRRGDRVAIALPPGEDFAVALHAIWRAGATAVPVDLRDREPRTAGARVVVDAPLGDGPDAALDDAHDLDAAAAVIHTSGSTGTPKAV